MNLRITDKNYEPLPGQPDAAEPYVVRSGQERRRRHGKAAQFPLSTPGGTLVMLERRIQLERRVRLQPKGPAAD